MPNENILTNANNIAEYILDLSIDMIIVVNLNREIVQWNPAAEMIFGYKKPEIIGKRFDVLCKNKDDLLNLFDSILKDKKTTCEFLCKKKEGAAFNAYISASLIHASDNENIPAGVIAIIRDISEHKNIENRLLFDSFHDHLTGLPNRIFFIDRLKFALNRTKRRKDYKFAVLVLDINRFKIINDSLGHNAGDQLIIMIACRIKGFVRIIDTLAHLGGDVFAILLEDINSIEEAKGVSDRLLKNMHEPFMLSGQSVFVTMSIGLAISTKGYEKVDDIIRDADTGMHKAKDGGQSRYEIFSDDMHKDAIKILQLEADLRQALDNHEFIVHYQPIIQPDNRKIVGVEALVRWKHPVRGIIPPKDFIPIAERTGLIISIGEWVIKTACRDCAEWNRSIDQELWVAVNFSNCQFRSLRLFDAIKDAILDHNINPHNFEFEITESTVMEDMELSIAILNNLHNMGIRIVMDDFGTGYSALASLRSFPVDKIKIDLSLVRYITTDKAAFIIAKSIIEMAHCLNLGVTSEGVETQEQFDILKEMHSDEIQGYLFSRPVSAEEIYKMLTADR